jgi:rubrerythrin
MKPPLPTSELRELVDSYTSDWGPVAWRGLKSSEFRCDDQSTGRMLYALALIEADSLTMRRRISAIGADRVEELLEFITIWLAEEAEHSRALTQMAQMHGFELSELATRKTTRDFRTLLTWPMLYILRELRGICAVYCTLGAMQEMIALTTYHYLASDCESVEIRAILKAIARQESHHMRFYRHAAELFLRDSKAAQRNTRILIERLWQPPGLDLLGAGNYEVIFGPILSNSRYATLMLRVDQVVNKLPGLTGIRVAADYLDKHGFQYETPDAYDPDRVSDE